MSFTWGDLETEINAEYDLSEELFVTSTEKMVYVNDAIRDVEKAIHAIPGAEKYYESQTALTTTNGDAYVDLPADIYANKITLLYYSDQYEIKPIKDLRQAAVAQAGENYRYRIENSTADGTRIRLYPAASETSSSNILAWYIRKAATVTATTDVVDVPEPAREFIKQYVIDQCANKERMTPDAPESAALKREREDLVSILSNMISDENNEVLPDASNYYEQV